MEYLNLTPINGLKTNELWIVQPKWYRSKYELTDNAFVYAKIYSKSLWQATTFFETTDDVLITNNSNIGDLEIKTADGSIIGTLKRKLFSGRNTLTLSNGRVFTYHAPTVWKAEYVWADEFETELMKLTFGSMSGKISVTFNKRAADIPNFFALVFIAFILNLDNSEGG